MGAIKEEFEEEEEEEGLIERRSKLGELTGIPHISVGG